jgi:hypothetical protein
MVQKDSEAARARELIDRHDVSVNPKFCGQCGYDLRGLPQARCPECGKDFRRTHLWRCADCGESSEVQFTHCWHCGRPRGDSPELPPEKIDSPKTQTSKWLMPPSPCINCHGTGRLNRPVFILISIASGLFSVLLLFEFLIAMHQARYAAPLYTKFVFAPLVFFCFFIAFRHRNKPCDCVKDDGFE